MKKHLLIVLLAAVTQVNAGPMRPNSTDPAKHKYWILLSQKDRTVSPALSPATLERRQLQGLPVDETDLPLSTAYLTQLRQAGVEPLCQSRWLNAVSAMLTTQQRQQLTKLSFVKEITPIDQTIKVMSLKHDGVKPHFAPVMSQIQADDFSKAGLTGRFVNIGVIDAGFFAADSAEALKHVFERNGVKAVRDYVNPEKTQHNLFRTMETMSDFHGTEVLAAISGLDPHENLQYGLATDATFYLARTDQGNREFRGEEDNWVQAMEWLDSLGVRLINTSLGYARGFSNPKENYEPKQMDGKTSLISRAAQMAADKKGILVIVSAGNEGDDRNWRIISTPADAKGVLSVGATNAKLWNRIGYSSIGPEALPYLKPNVACFSLYGTSLSAPVITGFAACLMQANPKLTNKQIIDIIEKSSHLYPYGNNYVGYGVPLASRAIALLKNQPLPTTARSIKADGKTISVPVNSNEALASVFRKKDATHVLTQEAVKIVKGKITLQRTNGEHQTTIDLKEEVIEVIWE